ncbi:hypothetical protein [Prosthecochloris sp.]|uniref:hypothetical protein n=1 Tax=Prosthecochloris sp. TaxID=290513 RepID=UPI0025EE0875|nr:hypothetical protein [Prosthecochloris sp.]
MSRVIYNDTVGAVSLQSGVADPGYPLSNLQNDHPRKPFRTVGGNSCVLRVEEPGLASAFAIIKTNATSVTLEVIVPATYEWGEDESGFTITAGEGYDGSTVAWVDEEGVQEAWRQTYDNWSGQDGILFAEFDPTSMSRTIDITLTAANDEYVSVGLLKGGETLYFRDFEHDSFKCSSDDHATEVELNDGSFYYQSARVLRKPSGYMVMYSGLQAKDPKGFDHYYDFMEKLWLPFGKTPMVWVLSEQGFEKNMFIGLDSEPIAVMHGREHKIVSLNFKERT